MDQLVQLLDGIKLPFELPILLHPPIVHFAIAIPVIALLLEISNLVLKRRCIGVISGLLITLAGIVYLAAFFTGKTDGSEAYSLLSGEGKEELKEHKLLGIYLVYGIWAVLVLKLIFMTIQKFWAKALFTLILAGFVAASFVQGEHGGEIVFKYGANNERVSNMDDKIMELEDEIDTLKEKCKEQPAKVEAPVAPQKEEKAQKTEPATQTAPAPKEEPQTQPQEQQAPASEQNSTANETAPTIEQKAKEALEQIKAKDEEAVKKVQEAASSQAPAAPQESDEVPSKPAQ